MDRCPNWMVLVPETRGRALWVEEVLDYCPHNHQKKSEEQYCASIDALVDQMGCLNCGLETHETNDCIRPSSFLVNNESHKFPRRMVLMKIKCNNNMSTLRYMLPFDCPLKGTVVNVNQKENCLYVRPQILDDVCSTLENTLFQIQQTVQLPALPSKINIGEVYLIRRQNSDVLARAVCAHMYVNWQMSIWWQMYLIDIGKLEFIDQQYIYPLPSELQWIPPMAVPIVLANCRVGYEVVECKADHFAAFSIGAKCIFALSSYYEGQPLSLSRGGYYPSAVSLRFPPPLLARVFYGTTLHDEIFCTWGLPENVSLNLPVCPLYCPSTFTFTSYTLDSPLPVTLTVRVTEKIDRNHYWLRDASLCPLIKKQIKEPANGLWPYVEENRSLACIVRLQRQLHKPSQYYRALASNFDNQTSRCTVFLVDYGQTFYCDVHDLFDLSDQPATVLYTCVASFKCAVSLMNTFEPEDRAAKLAVDEKYIIQVTGKEDEGIFVAAIDVYIQADFQYPNKLFNNQSTISSLPSTRPSIVGINHSNDFRESYANSQAVPETLLAKIREQASFNVEIANSFQALEARINQKLETMSNQVDALFDAFRSLQSVKLTGDVSQSHPSQRFPIRGEMQEVQQQIQSQTSPASDTTDISNRGVDQHRYSQQANLEEPFGCKSQPGMYSQQFPQQPFEYIPMNGRYIHRSDNPTYGNNAPQFHYRQRVPQPQGTNFPHQRQPSVLNCLMCSQQRGMGDHFSTCCFCGAFLETRLGRGTPLRQSPLTPRRPFMSRAGAVRLNLFPTPRLGFGRDSSSSTIDSSCKNSNTPSNVESQVSSRSSSPIGCQSKNQKLQKVKKSSRENCVAGCHETKEFKTVDVNFKHCDGNSKASITTTDKQPKNVLELTGKPIQSGYGSVSSMQNSIGNDSSLRQLKPGERGAVALISKKGECESAGTSGINSNSTTLQTQKNSSNMKSQIVDASRDRTALQYKKCTEMQHQNVPESCWICGKVGHLTRYCQSTPPAMWVFAQQAKEKENQPNVEKKASKKPRDEKGRVLYTSDESSSDEIDRDSDGADKQVKDKNDNYDIKRMPGNKGGLASVTKYKAYFGHVTVEMGRKYTVTRCDDDITASHWPLFFVQIQPNQLQQIHDIRSIPLVTTVPLTAAELIAGLLCIAHSKRFDAKYRAVIMAIRSDFAEVFYIDYGIYEWIECSSLWSISGQDQRVIIQPGLAIPCILNAYDEEKMVSRLSEEDVDKLKRSVSCVRREFYLKFRKQRPDGICVADVLIEEMKTK